ncbi:MAG: hypothetical protein LBR53_01600 [Deltaproteobacteria bacterium]|jgi:hypothetical protein|nr:hypothetical protein [Deltaproteobacteria bacterium]
MNGDIEELRTARRELEALKRAVELLDTKIGNLDSLNGVKIDTLKEDLTYRVKSVKELLFLTLFILVALLFITLHVATTSSPDSATEDAGGGRLDQEDLQNTFPEPSLGALTDAAGRLDLKINNLENENNAKSGVMESRNHAKINNLESLINTRIDNLESGINVKIEELKTADRDNRKNLALGLSILLLFIVMLFLIASIIK